MRQRQEVNGSREGFSSSAGTEKLLATVAVGSPEYILIEQTDLARRSKCRANIQRRFYASLGNKVDMAVEFAERGNDPSLGVHLVCGYYLPHVRLFYAQMEQHYDTFQKRVSDNHESRLLIFHYEGSSDYDLVLATGFGLRPLELADDPWLVARGLWNYMTGEKRESNSIIADQQLRLESIRLLRENVLPELMYHKQSFHNKPLELLELYYANLSRDFNHIPNSPNAWPRRSYKGALQDLAHRNSSLAS